MDKQTIEVLEAAVQAIKEGRSDSFEYELAPGGLPKTGAFSAMNAAYNEYKLRLPRKTVTITLPECVKGDSERPARKDEK